MKKTEKVLALLSLISIILKIFSIEGAIFLSALFFGILAFFYLFLNFILLNAIPFKNIFKKKAYTNISLKRIVWAIFVGMIFFIAVMAILFGLNKWGGGSFLLIIGSLLLFLVAVISLIWYIFYHSYYNFMILMRSTILIVVCLTLIVANFF